MLDKICYVTKSTYRTKVLLSLQGEIKMPKELAEDCDILLTHVSAVLKQLREAELVECLNPNCWKGRLYRLSPEGEKLAERLT